MDDDDALLRTFARALTRDGYEVDVAHTGEDAICSFEDGGYHVVVSDIALPGMTGIEVIDRVHAFDEDMPIVLITGMPTIETAIQAMDHGAMRYLLKPVDLDELRSVVAAAVRRRRALSLQRSAVEALESLKAEQDDHDGLRRSFDQALQKLWMAYQPIVRYSDRSVTGYEALVRSREPALPHPGALFDAAERLASTGELGKVIRQLTPTPFFEADPSTRLFFNLHVRDLEDETLYDPEAPMARLAERVVLEITERAALDDVKDAHACIARLREMGFSIAVDDLGAGYAGLNSFAELEPDVVKLDMTLVRDVEKSATKQKVVRSITTLCADMGMEVVAEGVETADELGALLGLGCDLFQGFFFAKPSEPFVTPTFG
ncbi:MAG: EAL domain-containing protein [Myxococcota bacterium]